MPAKLPPSPLSIVYAAMLAHAGYGRGKAGNSGEQYCDRAYCRFIVPNVDDNTEPPLPDDLTPGPAARRHPKRHRYGSSNGGSGGTSVRFGQKAR